MRRREKDKTVIVRNGRDEAARVLGHLVGSGDLIMLPVGLFLDSEAS